MDISVPDPSKPKAPSTHDPGWNDPPLFSYDATKIATQPNKRGPLLNKRVAFPMGPCTDSGSGAAQLPGSAGEPPLTLPPVAPPLAPPSGAPAGDVPPPATSLAGASPSNIPDTANAQTKGSAPRPEPCDSREALVKGVDILCQLVESLPADDKREKEDIQKRIAVLRKMCEDQKLNNDIYGRLVQLATSLQSGDTTAASHIQTGLMVDYVSLCSSWMAGVRLLVRRLTDPDS